MKSRSWFLAVAALAAFPSVHAAPQDSTAPAPGRSFVDLRPLLRRSVVYVDAAASGAATGHSWKDAFPDLQQALAAAQPGAELWIAAGTYTPGDAGLSFVLCSGLALYGGFAGNESARSQRDWRVYETVLSGDIGGDDYLPLAGQGWWWGVWDTVTPNSGHVVVTSGVDASAVLDGLTIANGNQGPAGTPLGDPLAYGSGVYNVGGSPTIQNCIFLHNRALQGPGGALYNEDGAPTIQACTFVENQAWRGDGGALFETGTGAALVEDCTFRDNVTVAESGHYPRFGGAIARRSTTPTVLARCTFERNACAADLRPLPGYGGGLSNEQSEIVVQDCVFTHNDAMYGAGMATFRSAQVTDCLFTDNVGAVSDPSLPPIRGGKGAGLLIYSYGPEVLTVVNTTIAYNRGLEAIGLLAAGASQAVLRNSIVWGNEAYWPSPIVDTWGEQLGGPFAGSYDCIQALFDPPPPGEDPILPATMPGSMQLDPLFVQPIPAGDLRLSAASPCIDAGDVGAVPLTVLTDLDGNPRFVDDPAVPDTGQGPPPIVDLGPYERQP